MAEMLGHPLRHSVGPTDSSTAGRRPKLPPRARRAVLAATVGTAIEWYDYSLYGTVAALVAGQLFFPGASPGVGLLAAFATFGVAYLARPFGGIVIGHIGDKYGRKPALMSSLVLMGTATFAIAFLPTYETIGIWATVFLVLLRLAQGFGAGAELAGALTVVAEHTPVARRGFYTSLSQTSSLVGVLLASVAFLFVSGMPEDQLLSWGWRVPFLTAGLLFVVALYVRAKLEESPEFDQAIDEASEARATKAPISRVLKSRRREIALAFVLMGANNVLTYTLITYVTSYLKNTVGMSAMAALTATSIGTAVGIIANPIAGHLCDRFGYRRVWSIALVATILGIVPFFAGLQTGNLLVCSLCMSLAFLITYAGTAGAYSGVFANLFPTEVRYSGVAFTKETSGALIAGPTPFVATALVLAADGSARFLVLYILAWVVASLVVLYKIGSIAENPEEPNLLL
ncbi:MHS family MFS transporter (plasmid) [Rhodococcus sp. USK10]|uniref:MFS transporter n=1 Tax=Rhodococcus sp. USK10 TaxID=2789739 RepID=UPI001C5E5755|nr:MFS transporter [Rhodococcus sp. USK10]QYB00180.1 MHS family MFS transporter [Rhodococcus sp. USK10]